MKTPRYMEIANYIINNQVTRSRVKHHFNISDKQLADSLTSLRKNDCVLHKTVSTKLKNVTKNAAKYIKIADYILEHNVSIQDAANHFNCSKNTATTAIYTSLKANNYNLYCEVISVLKMQRVQRSSYNKFAERVINEQASMSDMLLVYTPNQISNFMTSLKTNNIQLYKQVKQTFLSKKKRKYIDIANYIIEHNASNAEVANKFKISKDSIWSYLIQVKANNPELYEQIKESKKNP